ncbi:hypothetical protein PVK06_035360 [Gossypium arboreum]|uniref:Uncharacterized protein n=1 Tax=Gossypium arboreum TaxID=29729 RepID=A0ABR0NGL6_GOSAR|nr:hypothetical protein PVK06_035360 [Gossypium arboreum]
MRGTPVKDDVVGRDNASNPVEEYSTLDQQGVECMDLEGGASDLVFNNFQFKLGDLGALSSLIIMEDSIIEGNSIIMADYGKQVALDNVNTQFGPVSPIEENFKKPKKASWKRIARGVVRDQ